MAIIAGRIATGIHASGPAIMNSTAMKSSANRRSVAATTVPEVKNSRAASKSRIWLARTPTDIGRWAILIERTCSKISAARIDIEFLAGHVDDPRADGPQQEVENNGKGKPDRERSQRRNRTVRHDAVIDVHREERCGEPEHVDNECGNGDVAVIRSEAANDTPEPVRFREVSRCGRSFACRRGRPDEEDVTEIIVFEGGGPHFDLFARGRVDEGQLLCDCIDFGEDAGRLISGDQ